jgi:hypothetical protein
MAPAGASALGPIAVTPLRTNERIFAGDSTTNGHWREYCAGKHEGKRDTNQSKNKSVPAMITIGIFLLPFVDFSAARQ